MKQITITRDEFRERIVKNKRGFGIVKAMHDHPEQCEADKFRLALEEIAQTIVLMEIEDELFGKEGENNGNDEIN